MGYICQLNISYMLVLPRWSLCKLYKLWRHSFVNMAWPNKSRNLYSDSCLTYFICYFPDYLREVSFVGIGTNFLVYRAREHRICIIHNLTSKWYAEETNSLKRDAVAFKLIRNCGILWKQKRKRIKHSFLPAALPEYFSVIVVMLLFEITFLVCKPI